MPLSFTAYGLHIRSPFLLWEDGIVEETAQVDVEVALGSCPRPPALNAQANFQFDLHSALLFWPNIGCFWVREGRHITVEPIQGAAIHLLRPALLGPVLAMVLLQRGELVLHASAVALLSPAGKCGAVGFLGHSNQGKSTMATALWKRGHQPLADDTIAVPIAPHSPSQSGAPPLIFPALPHFKLRPPSLKALGETLHSLSRWHPDNDSFVVPLASQFLSTPAPLRSLYCLEEGETIGIEPMNPPEALANVLEHSYCMRLFPDEDTGDDFLRCAQLVRQIPVFRLRRPKKFALLPDVARAVEEHHARHSSDNNCS